MCFLTLGSAFAIGWIRDNRERDLLLSSICFLLSSTLRYEGWLVCATMASILSVQRLIMHRITWRTYLINIAILSSFPLYYILSAYFNGAMEIFSYSAQRYIDRFGRNQTIAWNRSFLNQFI